MGSMGTPVLKILRSANSFVGGFGAAMSTTYCQAAVTRIEGFWVYWGSEH